MMQSRGEQILDRFHRKRPDIDLSFLDEFDSEDVEGVKPVQGADDVEQAQSDAEQTAGGDGEQRWDFPREIIIFATFFFSFHRAVRPRQYTFDNL